VVDVVVDVDVDVDVLVVVGVVVVVVDVVWSRAAGLWPAMTAAVNPPRASSAHATTAVPNLRMGKPPSSQYVAAAFGRLHHSVDYAPVRKRSFVRGT
jgi:hypothetical protein